MIPLNEHLSALALRRPVFHSEADFQHALAWQIHTDSPEAAIRLEVPIECEGSIFKVDMLVRTPSGTTVVELKYKTRLASVMHGVERFNLVDQTANDQARHDFLKDVQRIELLVHAGVVSEAFAVLLTNDPLYWNQQTRTVNDSEFRLYAGRTISGELAWKPKAGNGTTKNRSSSLIIRGEHRCDWNDYSQVDSEQAGKFRCLVLRAEAPAV